MTNLQEYEYEYLCLISLKTLFIFDPYEFTRSTDLVITEIDKRLTEIDVNIENAEIMMIITLSNDLASKDYNNSKIQAEKVYSIIQYELSNVQIAEKNNESEEEKEITSEYRKTLREIKELRKKMRENNMKFGNIQSSPDVTSLINEIKNQGKKGESELGTI